MVGVDSCGTVSNTMPPGHSACSARGMQEMVIGGASRMPGRTGTPNNRRQCEGQAVTSASALSTTPALVSFLVRCHRSTRGLDHLAALGARFQLGSTADGLLFRLAAIPGNANNNEQ